MWYVLSVLRTVADYVRWTPPHFLNIPPPDSRLPPLARRNHIYQRITLVKLYQRHHHILLPLHPVCPGPGPLGEDLNQSPQWAYIIWVYSDYLILLRLSQFTQIVWVFFSLNCRHWVDNLKVSCEIEILLRQSKSNEYLLAEASHLKRTVLGKFCYTLSATTTNYFLCTSVPDFGPWVGGNYTKEHAFTIL